MTYYLWNQDTANLVGSYPTLSAALSDVATTARQYGRTSREVLSLGLTKGTTQAMAAGLELLDLAERSGRQRPAAHGRPRRKRAA